MKLEKYKLTVEVDLSNAIEGAREASRALCEFADKLENIERKYKKPQAESGDEE